MTARVLLPWLVGSTPPGAEPPSDCGRFRVWVADDQGRWRLAGEWDGTEGEAVASALAATGAGCAFAESCDDPLGGFEFRVADRNRPGSAQTLRGSAPGGKS